MNKNIYDIAVDCKTIAETQIKITRNQIIDNSRGIIFTDYDVSGNIKQYETTLFLLYNNIKAKYPNISRQLKEHIDQYDNDKIFHISAIEAIVNCIISLEEKIVNKKKIFISHSSNDEQIVRNFVDKILQLGIGICANDIFCTSIEDMNIKNGEDIRHHIQTNIKLADFSFLLISKNYKASEICLNEMGAVWAYDNNVRLYLLPDIDFLNIGWLCDTRQAEKINNPVALDKLYTELTVHYGILHRFDAWSRYRQDFVGSL